jgi:hypothetical protein
VAFPALLTLSSTDVGKADKQWVCEPLTVETVLESGEDLVYHIGRALYWIEQEAALIP